MNKILKITEQEVYKIVKNKDKLKLLDYQEETS